MSITFNTSSAVELPSVLSTLGSNIVGVEVGVWHGYNMGHLLESCPNIQKLHGIDPYIEYQDWNRFIPNQDMIAARDNARRIVNHFDNRAALWEYTSEEAVPNFVDGSLDFIFIDGDHSYERCYEDLNLWYSKVKPGGIFSGHDFSLVGVNRALLDFRTERKITGFFKVIPNDVWYWIKD